MQPNVITLAVDEQNDGVGPVNHVFTRFEEFQNRAVYIGPNHTVGSKNNMSLYRTFPKPNGTFRGVAKTTAKFSKDLLVTGSDGVSQLSAPLIGEVNISAPVGATAEEIKILRQKLVALLDDDTIMAPLNEQLMV